VSDIPDWGSVSWVKTPPADLCTTSPNCRSMGVILSYVIWIYPLATFPGAQETASGLLQATTQDSSGEGDLGKEGNFNQLVSDSIDVLTDNDASCVGSPCPEELPDILFMSAL
jgi:hypothetical protein